LLDVQDFAVILPMKKEREIANKGAITFAIFYISKVRPLIVGSEVVISTSGWISSFK